MDRREQYDLLQRRASCRGLLEPYFEVHKTLYDRGIVVEDDFSSSLTRNRPRPFRGEIAILLPEQLTMFSCMRMSGPECEIGFFGYPTDTPGNGGCR